MADSITINLPNWSLLTILATSISLGGFMGLNFVSITRPTNDQLVRQAISMCWMMLPDDR